MAFHLQIPMLSVLKANLPGRYSVNFAVDGIDLIFL